MLGPVYGEILGDIFDNLVAFLRQLTNSALPLARIHYNGSPSVLCLAGTVKCCLWVL